MYIAVPGMKKDCHDDLPDELLLSWNEEQLDYIHDMDYWRNILINPINQRLFQLNKWNEMKNFGRIGLTMIMNMLQEIKAVDAGACKYLNFISIVLQRVKYLIEKRK